MKKRIMRILGFLLIIILLNQNCCYADLYVPAHHRSINIRARDLLIVKIGILVVLVSVISYLVLKSIYKKRNKKEDIESTEGTLNKKRIERFMGTFKLCIYSFVTIFSLWWYAYVVNLYHHSFYSFKFNRFRLEELSLDLVVLLIFPAILYICSYFAEIFKKEKIANFIWISSLVLIIILSAIFIIPVESVELFNNRFIIYEFHPSLSSGELYTNDVEGLVETAIENNNKFGKKITIMYDGVKYKTSDQLEILLTKLDKNSTYYIREEYYNNDKSSYLETLELRLYVSSLLNDFSDYLDRELDENILKEIIEKAENRVREVVESKYYKNFCITIVYFDNDEKIRVDLDRNTIYSIKDNEEYLNLYNAIDSSKKYKIGIKMDEPKQNAIIITQCD